MLFDDDENPTFESPAERRAYRRYERLMDKAIELAKVSTDSEEFKRVRLQAETLYESFGSFD